MKREAMYEDENVTCNTLRVRFIIPYVLRFYIMNELEFQLDV